MLSKTAKTRLTTLIKFMEKLPRDAEEHFNMGMWFWHEGDNHHGLKVGQEISRRDLNQCGTQACALGWAATIPSLKKAGLSLHCGGIGDVRWRNKEMDAFDAAAECFDISKSEAASLFLHMTANTPKQWAKKARVLVKNWSE